MSYLCLFLRLSRFLAIRTFFLNICTYLSQLTVTSDWLSWLAARSRKGQVSGSKPGWERLIFCTSGARDGCCQISLEFRREY